MSNEIYSPIELTAPPYFEIESDDDFVSYGFPGSGNLTDPYIIENYTISGNYGSIIEIISTTKHFIIRNCNFTGGGIRIVHVGVGTAIITNNTIDGSYIGVDVGYADNCTITFNECRNNYGVGISINNCNFAYVVNNTCIDTDYYGMGLIFYYSPYSTIVNNTIIDGGMVGLDFKSSTFSNIINNSFTNGGFRCTDWDNYELYNVQSNTINGKLIGFFGNQSDLDLSDEVYGQFLLSSCDNVAIRNQDFSNAQYLLYAVHCVNLTVSDCNFSQGYFTLRIFRCPNLLFVNNHMFENHDAGNIDYVDGASITNNHLANNERGGIYITRSDDLLISNNTCNDNLSGISVYESDFITLENNYCNNNTRQGIIVSESTNSKLVNNTLSKNHGNGLNLVNSSNCLIIYNQFLDNTGYGVMIDDTSSNNLVHHNAFVKNRFGSISQGYDAGQNNTWYEEVTQEGNYWSNWNGTISYEIAGFAFSSDLYPLSEPPEYPPTIPPEEPTVFDKSNYWYFMFLLAIPIYGGIYYYVIKILKKDRKVL